MAGDAKSGSNRKVMVLGATGTIGRAVVRQLLANGERVTCPVRDEAKARAISELAGAELVSADISDAASLAIAITAADCAIIVSCLASRSGAPKDAWAIDYQANHEALAAAEACGAQHYILLSAICVQKPVLAFQHAKLAFENELQASGLTWSIVRPTAFFKSLSGQVERVRQGKPFLVFGNGELTRCKPISDRDCARYITDCIDDPSRHNHILPIGGPGPAISPMDQARMLAELLGREVPRRNVPIGMFSAAAKLLSLGAPFLDWCAEKAEYARIARYYATESMLVFDPDSGEYRADLTVEFGTDTLRDHYASLLDRGLSASRESATPTAS